MPTTDAGDSGGGAVASSEAATHVGRQLLGSWEPFNAHVKLKPPHPRTGTQPFGASLVLLALTAGNLQGQVTFHWLGHGDAAEASTPR
jgi:hypothetical protein